MPAIEPPKPRAVAYPRFDDAAVERLDVLLHQECLPQGGLPLEAADGLFSCAWVSPGAPLSLDDMLPVVLGNAAASAPEELVRLLHLMWEATGHRIMRGPTADPRDCLPLIGIPPESEDMEEGGPDESMSDVGSVWGLNKTTARAYDGTTYEIDDSMHVRAAIGVSLFWTTPIGPLRFNFSKAISKESYDKEQNFDLTISTKF